MCIPRKNSWSAPPVPRAPFKRTPGLGFRNARDLTPKNNRRAVTTARNNNNVCEGDTVRLLNLFAPWTPPSYGYVGFMSLSFYSSVTGLYGPAIVSFTTLGGVPTFDPSPYATTQRLGNFDMWRLVETGYGVVYFSGSVL